MKRHRHIALTTVIGLLAIPTPGQEQADRKSSPAEHLSEARQLGWMAAAPLIDILLQSDPNDFPGLQAFVKGYAETVKGLDPSRPPKEWPAIDIDAFVTRNPTFWRASFEVRPGDPAWLCYVHAGLLLGAGEARRAQLVMALARQSRGNPQPMRDAIGQMLTVAECVIRDGVDATSAGVTLFDKGDKKGAIDRYRKAIAIWPQNPFAHYELGLSLRAHVMEARGERPFKLGTVQVRGDLPPMPEVEECFARARRHDPLRLEAYQGAGKDVLPRLQALMNCLEPWQQIASSGNKLVTDDVIAQFSQGCQEAGLHDLAIVARQVLISRRGRFIPADHPFLAKSLRALAPGPPSEAALKLLDGPMLKLYSLVNPEPNHAQP